jgi:hypothetical protein
MPKGKSAQTERRQEPMIKSQRIYGHSERALMKATQRFHGLSSAVNQESEK